jgi:hypothetical protein
VDGTVDVVDSIFLVFIVTFLAASLVFLSAFLFGTSKKGSPYTLLVGSGFVLLAGCLVWLWIA